MELTPISTAFWKIAHNLKEIVNVQVLFVLTVGYINMTKESIAILLKEHILFTGCLYYLSVHCHSLCFYIQYHGGVTEITSMPV